MKPTVKLGDYYRLIEARDSFSRLAYTCMTNGAGDLPKQFDPGDTATLNQVRAATDLMREVYQARRKAARGTR